MNKKNIKEQLAIIFLVVLFIVLSSQGHPKILGMWEGSVIYNIFHPGKLPNLFSIIQKGADTVGHHGFDYNMLALARIFADYFGHSITVIKLLPITYGFITLFLLYIIIRRWFGWLVAFMSVIILMTNQYFLISSRELVASSTLSTMLLLFVIERYQKLEMNVNKLTIISFAFACALAATNYIVVRLLMIAIIIFYMIDIKTIINNNGISIDNLINKKKIKTTGLVLVSMIGFLFLFFPLNMIYLFNSNFLFPMTNEYAKDAISVFSSFYYNSLYIINYYIIGSGSLDYSTNLFVDMPFPLESRFMFILSFGGIFYALVKVKDEKYRFFLYLTVSLIGMALLSELKPNYEIRLLEMTTTMNHYRIFILILFIDIFAAITIFQMIEYLKQYDYRIPYLILCFFAIILFLRINAYTTEIYRFNNYIETFPFSINEPAFSKDNPINSFGKSDDMMVFEKRIGYHVNPIYFYKLSKHIEHQIKNKGEEKGIIYINPDYYTPDYYRLGGGDIPWKGYPYYFQMYLTFYLQELGLNSSYLVNKDYVDGSILKKIINIVYRYNNGKTKPGSYPKNETEVKNVVLANKIISFISSFSLGKLFIDNILSKEHHYDNVIRYGDYYLNVTSREKPHFIIATNQDEIDLLKELTDNKILVNLPGINE